MSSFSDIDVSVLGTIVSAARVNVTESSSFTLAKGAVFLNHVFSFVEAGLVLNGSGSVAQIDGTVTVPDAIGLATLGGRNTILVTGSISASSGILLAGTIGGDVVINSGQIIANSDQDLSAPPQSNNAVFSQVANSHVTNLAGGVMMATSSQGNGLRLDAGGTGAVIVNHGTIQSVNAAAIDVSSLALGATARLTNTGLILGSTAFNGAGGCTFTLLNSGQMVGDVLLGAGDDRFDGRGGRLDGAWSGGAGADRYDGRGATLITGAILGGLGNDTLLGGGGDETLHGDENLDTILGGGGDDQLFGGAQSDYLDGGDGNDDLNGGADFDELSGSAGEDILLGGDGGLIGHGGSGNDSLFVDITETANFVGGYGGAGEDFFQGGLIRDNI